MSDLNALLLQAHCAGDSHLLVELYGQAAAAASDEDAAAFYLTHAHVFALETGHAQAPALRQRLIDQGREEALPPPRAPLR